METVPSAVLNKEILGRLDIEALCSLACVNRALRFSVESQALPSLSSLHLSTISPDGQTLIHILGRCKALCSLTLNCLRLQDHSLCAFLTPRIRELNLWCCSSLSYQILASIGHNCPNLRVLMLELADKESPHLFENNLAIMLTSCLQLESLSLKIRGFGVEVDACAFQSIIFFLPITIKSLKLQPVLERDAFFLIRRVGRNLMETVQPPILTSSYYSSFNLRSLSLVLDVITDELLITITASLPFLVELDLEDRPNTEPLARLDLTNSGLQSLGSCHHLTGLSLTRCRYNHQGTFKRVNDMGMFLLSEGCKGLESVRLGGFSKGNLPIMNLCLRGCKRVTDKGISHLLCVGGTISQSLTTLDLGYLPGISDDGILTIAAAGIGIIDLCVRSCFYVTDASVEALARKQPGQEKSKQLRRLDLCNCIGLSVDSLRWVKRPSFRGLHWLGIGQTRLASKGNPVITEIHNERPWLTFCLDGCEIGCHDGWQFHESGFI
ncbi:F-box protein At-B [Citrus sinensis]|uniref:F-box protein At-B n=1 Tax=Citrus sinensis TaxID=2711 RepID=A0ACB8P2C7_CITSI|nr:F-box protein At-B [Citrus sinensis]